MLKKINLKVCKLSPALILTLTLFIPTVAQTQEKSVVEESQISDKASAADHRISGTLTMNPEGQPIAKADVEIRAVAQPSAVTPLFAERTQTDEQGRWTIDKVPDGDYLLVAGLGSRLAKDKNGWFKELNTQPAAAFVARTFAVKISGTDVDNFPLQVIRGGRIIGKIVMVGGESFPESLIVLPEQKIKDGRSPVRMAPVQPDGSFVLEGVPVGDIIFKVFVFGRVKEFYTKSAKVGDVDLLSETLSIRDGSDVKDVHVVFAKVADK